jgi:hypothetical protein
MAVKDVSFWVWIFTHKEWKFTKKFKICKGLFFLCFRFGRVAFYFLWFISWFSVIDRSFDRLGFQKKNLNLNQFLLNVQIRFHHDKNQTEQYENEVEILDLDAFKSLKPNQTLKSFDIKKQLKLRLGIFWRNPTGTEKFEETCNCFDVDQTNFNLLRASLSGC